MGLVRRVFGRGLGVIAPSMHLEPNHAHVSLLSGLSKAAPSNDISLKEHCGIVLFQAGTESCLSQSLLDAAVTTASARYGKKRELPSRRLHYFILRRMFQRPVQDGGGYMSHGLLTLDDYGFTAERFFPWKPLRINEKPSSDLIIGSWSRRKRRTYAIHSQDELDACLHSRRACVICVKVDDAFTKDDGPDVIEGPPRGHILGGHAMEVVAVMWVAGRRRYLVKNSWGTSWRDGGYAWLDEWWVQNAYDMAVVDLEEEAA